MQMENETHPKITVLGQTEGRKPNGRSRKQEKENMDFNVQCIMNWKSYIARRGWKSSESNLRCNTMGGE